MSEAATMLSVADLARRFGKGTRWAARRMREMTHRRVGTELFTTEEWLAEWLAADAVRPKNWPPGRLAESSDAFVCERVIEVIGDLARRGLIIVKPV